MQLDFNNKEQVQKEFDELTSVMVEQKNQLEDNARKMTDASKTITDLSSSVNDMAEAIKAIHILLGSKKDLWADDVEVNNLMSHLAVIVSGADMIKLGVVSNAKQ